MPLDSHEQRWLVESGDPSLMTDAIRHHSVSETAFLHAVFADLNPSKHMWLLDIYAGGNYGTRQEITERYVQLLAADPTNRYARNFVDSIIGSLQTDALHLLLDSLTTPEELSKGAPKLRPVRRRVEIALLTVESSVSRGSKSGD